VSGWSGGALCVLAAMSARASLRTSRRRPRALWEIGAAGAAVIVASAFFGDAGAVLDMAVALSLAVVAALLPVRADFVGSASTQASLVTFAFATCLVPEWGGAGAVIAGGAVAGAAVWAGRRHVALPVEHCGEPWHLLSAGASAAIAYGFGVRSGAFALVTVCAMASLICAHLALALAGRAAAALASLTAGAAACALTVVAAADGGGAHGALVVAGVALAVGCGASYGRRFSPGKIVGEG
jgi:hypothetical protein